MRLLIALDGSEVGDEVMRAVAPWINGSNSDVLLLTIVALEEYEGTSATGHWPLASGAHQDQTSASSTSGARGAGGVVVGGTEPPPRVAEDRSQAIDRARAERIDYLEKMASSYLDGVQHEAHVEGSNDPAEAIAEFAGRVGVQLVVVGSHGRTGIRRALLGSVVQGIIRRSPVPVVVVRQGMTTAAAEPADS